MQRKAQGSSSSRRGSFLAEFERGSLQARRGAMAGALDGAGPVLALATHAAGGAAVVLVSVWVFAYRGGVAWNTDEKQKIFNWHPLLMLGGFIFLYGEAILTYRILPGTKALRKTVHAVLNGLALLAAVIGVIAAFKYHNEAGILNMYSLHSWFGLATLILFGIQWVVGFVTFLYPGAAVPARQVALPWHTFAGVFIYILALTTATQGILEKLTFLFYGGLERTSTEARLGNVLGLLVYLLGALVIFTAVSADRAMEGEAFRTLE